MRLDELQDVALIKSVEWVDRTADLLPLVERNRATNESLRAIGPSAIQAEGLQSTELLSEVITDRARRLLPPLLQRHPILDELLALSGWRVWAGVIALVAAIAAGAVAGRVSGVQRVLALPFLLVVAWNAIVYLMLAWFAVREMFTGDTTNRPAIMLAIHAIGRRLSATLVQTAKVDRQLGDVCQRFMSEWRAAAGPILAQQLRFFFHLCAVAFAVALIVASKLSLNIEDPSPDCSTEEDLLKRLLFAVNDGVRPIAARLGVELPPIFCGQADPALTTEIPDNGRLAPYLNFGAIVLLITVIIPRLVLAGHALFRSGRLQSASYLPSDIESYARGVLLGDGAQKAMTVFVFPYGQSTRAELMADLENECRSIYGQGAAIELRPFIQAGNEDAIASEIDRSAGSVVGYVILSDLARSTDGDTAGRLVTVACGQAAKIGKGLPVRLVIDEFTRQRRFEFDWWYGRRMEKCRKAWREIAHVRGIPVTFLGTPTAAATATPPKTEST